MAAVTLPRHKTRLNGRADLSTPATSLGCGADHSNKSFGQRQHGHIGMRVRKQETTNHEARLESDIDRTSH
jgi:hypothetical protein